MFLDISPRATVFQLLDATLAHHVVALLVNDLDDLLQIDGVFCTFLHKVVQLVAELRPGLTASHALEKRIGDTDILLDIML